MEAVTYSAFRNNLRSYMDRARDSAEALLVTSSDPTSNVVVMSSRDYDSLMETVRIYENPYLRDKIVRGMEQARAGKTPTHELTDD